MGQLCLGMYAFDEHASHPLTCFSTEVCVVDRQDQKLKRSPMLKGCTNGKNHQCGKHWQKSPTPDHGKDFVRARLRRKHPLGMRQKEWRTAQTVCLEDGKLP